MKIKVYIASRFTNKDAVLSLSQKLSDCGLVPIQTWPHEHDGCTAKQAAIRDLNEIKKSDALLLFTVGCPSVPGGMHFEAGYALAKGKAVTVIGPPVHVFCQHPDVMHYETLEDFFALGLHDLECALDARLFWRIWR